MDSKATTDITIVFSNIDGDSGSTYPGQKDTKSVTGKSVNGVPMVKVSDIATYMGATASYTGTEWTLKRNGQSSVYTQNGTAFYNTVYKEFCAGNSAPIKSAGFYRTCDFTNGKSKGYEIETMPRNGVTWLHLQVKPGIDTANDQP